MDTVQERRRRLTREESRAQTRDRLIEAAYDLFAAEGIEATTIDRIAEQAGYSRGAFYSNFQTKEELLAALMDRESEQNEEEFQRLEDPSLSPEQMTAALREYALELIADRKSCLFHLELEMYAVRHPEIRDLVGKWVQKDTQGAARMLNALFRRLGITDHPSTHLMISSYIAMAHGLTMRQVVEPATFSDEVVRASLGLYFDSVLASTVPPTRSRDS